MTTSTDVLCCSNTSKIRRRNPCAISMRVDVMSTTVTPFFDATAVSGLADGGRSRVISVPTGVLADAASSGSARECCCATAG